MRTFILLFALSLSLRLGMLTLIPADLIPPNEQWETGAVAIHLVTRGEFADPYLIPTGPTAHVPPLQPFVMSLLYRVLGTGFVGGLVRWILVMVAYSLLWALMPWVGERLGVGRKAGIVAGIAGTFWLTFPSETESFTALIMALMAVAFLARWEGRPSGSRSWGKPPTWTRSWRCGGSFCFWPERRRWGGGKEELRIRRWMGRIIP